jgi:DUF1680 family protein
MSRIRISRRDFTHWAAAGLAAGMSPRLLRAAGRTARAAPPLAEFGYGDVVITSEAHEAQLRNTHEVLMNLSEDSLLKPFRQMAGLPAPGDDLGGWYDYDPGWDGDKHDVGLAPGATFGQWVSALARCHAITGSPSARDKVLRLNRLYAATISDGFYDKNRFPAYCYDKLTLGLIDSHQFAGDRDAFAMLDKTADVAIPNLPAHAVDRELEWRPGRDQSYRWDESYTVPENQFLAYQRGAGARYRDLGERFLLDASWFDPLAQGQDVLDGKHAYSYVNSLSSGVQAYLTLGSEKHLHAATNGFSMLSAQSFATGGWGPDEKLVAPDSGGVDASLEKTHYSFETPCGAYAHFKLTRYLLRISRDSRYGDSMERMMYNTVLGALPMHADGRSFYYADYHFGGNKTYSNHRFPCCSGTLPQVAADYRINTYFRDARGVHVNLYIPSRVAWRQDGANCTLAQSGDYPFDDVVALRLTLDKAVQFTLSLRIPAWAEGARIEVNGRPWRDAPVAGRFAAISRSWRDGDRIELQLPRRLRLEPVDARHPTTVAVLCGPLVLFPVHAGAEPPPATREELLAARQTERKAWTAGAAAAALRLLPYTAIGDERYSTYLRVS